MNRPAPAETKLDIAATLLGILGQSIPQEMTGKDLRTRAKSSP